MKLPTSKHNEKRRKISKSRLYKENGEERRLTAHISWDDVHGNGHNTFSIVGDIYWKGSSGLYGGCVHDIIARACQRAGHTSDHRRYGMPPAAPDRP